MNRLYLGGSGLACLAVVAPANGQARDEHAYDLPAQPLGSALMAIARTSGQAVMVDAALVAGRRAPPLKGRFDAAGALARVLAGSGLRAEPINQGFVVRPSGTPQVRAEAEQSPDTDIVVTGSRIRGAPVASTLIVRTADTIRNEGQATLADVIRTIPQNLGGGQNPGIGANVPAASGVNVGSGSSLNLRGLGSDATLTLLNGRRLAYSASRQSVDVSAIPVNAVERIEIVADGASALYGSDAIAGVANIRLRRDAQGLTTSARLGASIDGGNVEQVYGLVAGKRWSGGGMLLAYEFGRSTAIRAVDRDYARDRVPGLDLYPSLRRHSVVLSGHQGLGDAVELSLDLLYNNRRSFSQFPLSAAGVTPFRHAEQPSESDSAAIAPALRWSPGSWRFELAGSAGRDRVHYATNQFTGTQLTSRTFGCYCNDAHSVELAADGPLFALPGGPAKIALGVGYRDNRLVSQRGDNSAPDVDAHQDSRYAYAEASLPLVGPAQAIPAIHRLDASLALRHEDYPGVDAVTTPKLGLVYAPTPDVSLKASWGRSFRAPTLLQRYQPLVVAALPATVFGGTGLPSGATALLLSGGRDSLQPERARSWSTTLALHPRAVDGLSVEISYFETLYRDRIVAPVTFIGRALADPAYADQVLRSPSLATLESLRLAAGQFLNATGRAYDPTSVVAVIDNANRNAGRQRVQGLDMLARLDRSLGAGQISATLSGAYLQSDQQLTPAQPVVDLAGTIFNPPHVRGRAALGWTQGGLTLTGAVSRIGGVEDRRSTSARRIGGMTQGDLTLRYRTGPGPAWWHGVDLIVTAQNILDARPSSIATTLPYDTPYDSTNYSPFGRVLAISASKSW